MTRLKEKLPPEVKEALDVMFETMEDELNVQLEAQTQLQALVGRIWNATNVVLRALVNRKLFAEDDLKLSADQLNAEAKLNMEKVKQANAEKRRPEGIIESPIETVEHDGMGRPRPPSNSKSGAVPSILLVNGGRKDQPS